METSPGPVQLVAALEAEMVRLAGEFNGWQPELMEREEGGGWARSLRLRPGRYQYKFVRFNKLVNSQLQLT